MFPLGYSAIVRQCSAVVKHCCYMCLQMLRVNILPIVKREMLKSLDLLSFKSIKVCKTCYFMNSIWNLKRTLAFFWLSPLWFIFYHRFIFNQYISLTIFDMTSLGLSYLRFSQLLECSWLSFVRARKCQPLLLFQSKLLSPCILRSWWQKASSFTIIPQSPEATFCFVHIILCY